LSRAAVLLPLRPWLLLLLLLRLVVVALLAVVLCYVWWVGL